MIEPIGPFDDPIVCDPEATRILARLGCGVVAIPVAMAAILLLRWFVPDFGL